MTKADEIRAAYQNRAMTRWGMWLLRPVDAISLIHSCRASGLRILGLDAFIEHIDGIQPSMDNSVDFTIDRNIGLLEDSWLHAERFLREHESSPCLFEVVIEPDSLAAPEPQRHLTSFT